MREILSIHVGQCGNQIADRFWRLVLKEHGLHESGAVQDTSAVRANTNQEVFSTRCATENMSPAPCSSTWSRA
jgi:hypothetical protein